MLSANIIVTSSADSGNNTLRAAITAAEASATPTTITFASGLGQINLNSELKITTNGANNAITIGVPDSNPADTPFTISGQNATRVFEIASGSNVTIAGLTIENGNPPLTGTQNSLDVNNGGGILNAGTLSLLGDTLTNNNASGSGGGVYSSGTLTAVACSFIGNIAGNNTNNTTTFGGGIDNVGSVTVTDCTFNQNRTSPLSSATSGSGGGLSNDSAQATATVVNSTFTVNYANLDGGGIYNLGTLHVTYSTIAGNLGGFATNITGPSVGGGIDNAGTATLVNTLVAENVNETGGITPSDLAGNNVVSAASRNNLIGDAGSAGGLTNNYNSSSNTGNIVGATPAQVGLTDVSNLPTLQNNGGPTLTSALLTTSLAIGHGTPVAGLTTDQRGFARNPNTPEIGAYERTILINVTSTADEDNGTADASQGSGTTLREAINLASSAPLPAGAPYAAVVTFTVTGTITLTLGQLFDTNTAGPINIVGPVPPPSVVPPGITVNGNGTSRVFGIGPDANATISNLTIENGNPLVADALDANGDGGGILNQGTLTLQNCTVTNNTASLTGSPGLGDGGGLFNSGTATVVDSTFAGNQSNRGGGGIWNQGTLTVTFGTIAGNVADANNNGQGVGGGIRTSTVTTPATTTLVDTLVANNTHSTNAPTPSDLAGNVAASSTNNLIGDAATAGGLTMNYNPSSNTGNIVGLPAGLDPNGLQSNGGPTQTIALLFNPPTNVSFAVGAGTPVAGVTTDQRGITRSTSTPDIGAYEVAVAPTANPDTFVINSTNVSNSAAISVLANDISNDGQPQKLVATLVTQSANGTLTFLNNGAFNYTPNPSTVASPFQGFDSFTYQVSENGIAGNTVPVNVLSYHASLVDKLYNQVLHRSPVNTNDIPGMLFWTGQLDQGKALDVVAQGIFNSPERLNPLVTNFYNQFLLRGTDPGGLAFWVQNWQATGDSFGVAASILGSPEFLQDAASSFPSQPANNAFVNLLYARVLPGTNDPNGVAFWEGKLNSGQLTMQQVANQIYSSPQNHINLVSFLFGEYFNGDSPSQTPAPQTYETDLDNGQTQTQVELLIVDSPQYQSLPPAPAAGSVGVALFNP